MIKDLKKQLRSLKDHRLSMQAHRAGANQITLGFLDAIEEEHDKEINGLQIKIRLLTPPKKGDPTFGVSQADIALAKTIPISTFLKIPGSKKVMCLFHQDKNPSMHIYGTTYHCFTCQAHGTIIDVVMKLRATSFTVAVKFLLNK